MYQHTQIGTTILVALGIVIVVTVFILIVVPFRPGEELGRSIAAFSLLILLGVAFLFGSLTISVNDGMLIWKFGPGLIQKSVRLSEIAKVERTRTSVLAGWGIHWTSQGWLYNVSGFDAVLIQLKSGERFLLGTDDPDRLIFAIQAAQASSAV